MGRVIYRKEDTLPGEAAVCCHVTSSPQPPVTNGVNQSKRREDLSKKNSYNQASQCHQSTTPVHKHRPPIPPTPPFPAHPSHPQNIPKETTDKTPSMPSPPSYYVLPPPPFTPLSPVRPPPPLLPLQPLPQRHILALARRNPLHRLPAIQQPPLPLRFQLVLEIPQPEHPLGVHDVPACSG